MCGTPGALCSIDVRSNQQQDISQWCKKTAVCSEGKSSGCPPTNKSSSSGTRQARCISSWALLGTSTSAQSSITKSSRVGWTMGDSIWKPFWTILPDVTKSCQELVRCGCKKGCQGRCSCTKAGLRCTALCTWTDDCDNTWLLFKLLMVAFLLK